MKDVAFSCDDNGAKFLCVTVWSLLKRRKSDEPLRINILEGFGGHSAENKARLQEIVGGFGATLRYHNVEKAIEPYAELIMNREKSRWNVFTWTPVFVPLLLSDATGNVAHFDIDMLFNDDVSKILDLDRGELAGWECDYPTFLKRKAELLADEAVYWERKSKKLAQEEAWIRRGVKARTTRNEGRVAALMKLRAEFAARRGNTGSVSMRLDTAAPGGESVLKIKEVNFSYPSSDKVIIKDFTTTILRGERIGVLGLNGAGKTTLLNLLTGKLKPSSGTITEGTNIKLAFFDQLRAEMKSELTVAENLAGDRDEVVVGGVRKHVYSYLADFLFSSERSRTPVKALSGGERALTAIAILFAILKLRPMPFCVLDEIEAALDEANVDRFARYLKKFTSSKKIDKIVIEINKISIYK